MSNATQVVAMAGLVIASFPGGFPQELAGLRGRVLPAPVPSEAQVFGAGGLVALLFFLLGAAGTYLAQRTKKKTPSGQTRGSENPGTADLQQYLDVVEVILVALDQDGRVEHLNRRGCELLGWSEKEVIGKSWFDTFIPETDREHIRTGFHQLIAGENEAMEYFENDVLPRDGGARTVAWHNTLLRDASGRVVGTLSAGQDVTEWKLAEAALRESEETSRALFEDAPLPILEADFSEVADRFLDLRQQRVVDLDAHFEANPEALEELASRIRILRWNRAYQDTLGGEDSKDGEGRLSVEASEAIKKLVVALWQGETSFSVDGLPHPSDKRSRLLFDVRFKVLPGYEKNLGRVLAAGQEVSRQRSAAQALVESEARFRSVFEASPLGILLVDPDEGITSVNPAAEDILGYPREELTGRFPSEITHPEDQEPSRTLSRKMLTGEGEGFSLEKRFQRRDGTFVPCRLSTQPIHGPNGELVAGLGIIADVTKLKTSEAALAKSERRFRNLVETSQDLIWQCDLEGRLRYLNPAWEETHGLAAEELLGKKLQDLAKPSLQARDAGMLDVVFSGLAVRGHRTEHTGKDGKTIHLLMNALPMRGRDNSPVGAQGAAYDLTDLILTEEALRSSEARFRATFEQAAVGVTHLSQEGRLLRVNKKLAEILGYATEELTGTLLADVIHSEDSDALLDLLGGIWNGTIRAGSLEGRFVRRDGTLGWLSFTSTLARDQAGGPGYEIAVIEDISQRKAGEEELKESRRRLQNLAARMEEARENERAGIARELHDELGQNLTALRMDLVSLTQAMDRDRRSYTEDLHGLVGMVDESIASVQSMSARLRTPILDVLGLRAAVEWQVEEFTRRSGIRCHAEITSDFSWASDRITTATFRILQEALTNVARHAQAQNVAIRLVGRADRGLLLEVEDDGIGVPAAALSSHESLGLIGMRERAEGLSGTLEIEALTKGGTRIRLQLPERADNGEEASL